MHYISLLKDAHQYDSTSVGGKAVNLSRLISAGLPVPQGFLVFASAYEKYISENSLQAEIERLAQTVSLTDPASAEQAALAIQTAFEQGTIAEEIKEAALRAYQQLGSGAVAVRSSATVEDMPEASFAGQQETFLNVRGEEELLRAIWYCWASLWTARALIYRARRHIAPQSLRMAVIVQQMVEATTSGVLFTSNPVTGARDEMVINASWGLGETLVSGHVSPDVILLNKESGRVKSVQVAEKQLMTITNDSGVSEQAVPLKMRQKAVLLEEQIGKLYQIGCTIEQLFSVPQDIEWAIAENQLHVLQTRPITTQPSLQAVTVPQSDLPVPGDDSWDRQGEQPLQPFDLWTHTNLGENFLDPVTPVTETLWPIFFLYGRLPSNAERTADAPPLPTLGQRFYGRIYINEGAVIHGATEVGIPSAFLDTTWGSSGRGLRSSDETFHFFRLLGRLPSMVNAGRKQAKQQPKTPKQQHQKTKRLKAEQLFAQIDRWVEDFQQQDMRQFDDRALWNTWMPLWIQRGKALVSVLIAAQVAALFFYLLERRLYKWTGKKGQVGLLIQALSGVFTAEIGPAFWHMAQTLHASHLDELIEQYPAQQALVLLQERQEARQFMDDLQAFLQRHGYRCPNDAELHNPRWAEVPEQVIDLLKSYLYIDESMNPIKAQQRGQQEREEATTRIAAQLNPLRRWIFRWLLKQTQEKVRLRDNNRSYVAKFLYPMRLLINELGRRWASGGWLASPDDIFFLTLYEIDDIISEDSPSMLDKDLKTVVSERRKALDYWHTIVAPAALGPGGVPLPDPEPGEGFLTGLPASAGRVRGTARVVRSLEEAAKLSAGDILVTQSTDPGWTVVFPLVSGLVLEVGGQLSHGAIIAREYGIPAIINVPGALHSIQDGQTIEVDGTNGRVYLDVEAQQHNNISTTHG